MVEIDLTTVPRRSSTAKHNMGVLFDQFNELNFYVEDEFKENFYLQILRKLFPTIQLDKIFGLGGKAKVIDAAKSTLMSKKDIYILDLDFDDILGIKENLNNIFYLNRYSIENFLIEQEAIRNITKDEKTTVKNDDIDQTFNVDKFSIEVCSFVKEISPAFLMVRKFELSIGFFDVETNRDMDFDVTPHGWKGDNLDDYKNSLKTEFLEKYPDLNYEHEYEWCKQFFEDHLLIINTPGKLLMRLLKDKIKKTLGVVKYTSYESFNYRMGNHCDLHSLHFLRDDISAFIA